jgi:hypothetical protein
LTVSLALASQVGEPVHTADQQGSADDVARAHRGEVPGDTHDRQRALLIQRQAKGQEEPVGDRGDQLEPPERLVGFGARPADGDPGELELRQPRRLRKTPRPVLESVENPA